MTAIAIHWWGDPKTKPTLSGVVNWFKNPASQASAHWVVSEDQAVQMVLEHDTAWTTAAANPYTISIEIDPQLTERTYQSVGQIVREIRSRNGNLPLKRHRDLTGGTICPGHTDLAKIERYATNSQGGNEVKIGTGQNWKNRMNRLHRQLVRNANMSESVFKSIQGKDAWSIVESWSDHPESNTLIRYQEIGQAATKGNWEARLKAADEALKANAKTIEELKATIETTTTKTKAQKDALIDQIAALTESLKATQEQYEEAKKQTNIVVDVGGDTQSWLEKLINLFRR